MTVQTFKKEAKKLGRNVYSIRKIRNKFAEGYKIIYAAILSENTVSVEQEIYFWEEEKEDILISWS
jgi:hypothetical protein